MSSSPSTTSAPETSTKKNRPKGPIRWGGLIPMVIFAVLVTVYVIFFFDGHLRRLVEYAGTEANGARVDVGYLKTSFLKCDFEMGQIQVTNRNEPMKNMVEVGRVHFQFQFAPILKKKLVVNDMSIDGLAYGTARKTSGAVPPKKDGPSFADRITKGVETALKEKVGESPFKNIEGLLSGANAGSQVQKLGEDSYSFKRAKEVEKQIEDGTVQWRKVASEVPGEKEVTAVKTRVDNVTKTKINNAQDALKLIQEIDGIKKDVDSNVQKVTAVQQTLTKSIDDASKAVTSVDEAMNKDVASVRETLKIPNLDFKDLTPYLLGPQISKYINQAAYWAEMSRKYLPKKKKQDDNTVEHQRASGRDIHFGRVASFPTLLIYRTAVTSNVSEDAAKGKAKGEILGITSDPPIYGKPTTAELTVDLPQSRIYGASVSAIIDHVTENEKETFAVAVNSVPVEEWVISSDPNFSLAVSKAVAKATTTITFENNTIKANIQANLADVQYAIGAQNAKLKEIITNVLKPLQAFQVRVQVEGKDSDLSVNAVSDLGEKIAAGLKAEFQAQFAAVEAQIRKQINDQVEGKKRELTAKLDQVKTQVLAPVNKTMDQINQVKAQAEKEKQRLENEKNKFLQNEGQKKLEEVKKKIKLPF